MDEKKAEELIRRLAAALEIILGANCVL